MERKRGVPAAALGFEIAMGTAGTVCGVLPDGRIVIRSEDGELVFLDRLVVIQDAEVGALIQMPHINTVVFR